MKLDEVIRKVAASTGIARPDARKAIVAAFAEIKTAVVAGERVGVPGIGAFHLKERAAGEKIGKDGKVRQVTAARLLAFKPTLKAAGASPAAPKKKKKKRNKEAAASGAK